MMPPGEDPGTSEPGSSHLRWGLGAKSALVQFRLSDTEREALFALAASRGTTVSQLIREAVIGQHFVRADHRGLPRDRS